MRGRHGRRLHGLATTGSGNCCGAYSEKGGSARSRNDPWQSIKTSGSSFKQAVRLFLLWGVINMKVHASRTKIGLASAFSLLAATGCATIFGYGQAERLQLRSSPDQAAVTVFDEGGAKVFEGTTPTSVSLEKKKGYFSSKAYTIKVAKPGHDEQVTTVAMRVNGWYIGNILFGGLIGFLIVDPLTGAMFTLETTELNTTLSPTAGAPSAPTSEPKGEGTPGDGAMIENARGYIVLLQDVPPEMRSRMVRIRN
ncbi:hypothetical protein [Candidatus Accumulibacter phosphatis]|uniref:hypothetical protein n=1 Tax=Candidatus Accumulibacter phosphatis TaxID=327160 RepID=UPI0039B83A8D